MTYLWQATLANPYILILDIAALLATTITAYTWRGRILFSALGWLALAIAIWVLFYALELKSVGLEAKLRMAQFEYIGMVSTPIAWLICARQYSGNNGWPTRRGAVLLLAIPLLTLVLVWTNHLHGLIWSSVFVLPDDRFSALQVAHGPWFWVHAAYCYALLALGSAYLLNVIQQMPDLYRRPAGIMLLCGLAPWLANALSFVPVALPYPLDLTPFGLVLSILLLGWLLFGFGLPDVAPIAYSTIFQGLRGVIVLDLRNRVVDLNREAQRIIGANPATAIGQPIAQLLTHQTELIARCDARATACLEITLGQRTYDAQVIPLFDQRGQIRGCLLALAEATQRKRAEATQRERALVAQAADAIVLIDPAGQILDTNEHATTLLGYTHEELLSMYLDDLLDRTTGAGFHDMSLLQQSRRTFMVQRKDRSFCPLEISVGAFSEPERPVAIVIMRDISERLATERRLQCQNEELTALYETTLSLANRLDLDSLLETLVLRAGTLLDSPHGYLYVLDPDKDELAVRIATGVFANQLGYRLKRGQGLAGRVWETGQALWTDDHQSWPARLLDLDGLNLKAVVSVPLWAGTDFVGVLGLAYLDETRRFNSTSINLLRRFADVASLALKNARLYSGARQELAERRRAEEALRTAEAELRAAKELAEASTQAKSEFLAYMSHDMRTPLSSAIGIAALLELTNLDAEQRKMVQIIHTSGEVLLDLLNNFLDIAKIEAGKLILEQHPFKLRACVEEAIDLVTGKVADRSLDLAYALDPAAPAIVIGDHPRLRQILVNLLSNAVKFTDTGGIFIFVAARALAQDRYELHFSVADTGAGIPPEEIETVFDSFQQLDSNTVPQSLGTGLGLTIGKRLSEVMGGRMWVESAVGAGSTFHFTIVVGARLELAGDQLAAFADLAGKHLLVVDRHPQSRQAVCLYAQAIGMRVSAAGSALEALEWAAAGARYDVAIADIRDAGDDQIMLAGQLREQFDMPALPMILLAPLGMQDTHVLADEYDLLHKPLKLSQLQAALLEIFADRRRPQDTERADHQPNMPDTMVTFPRILIAEDDRANQQLALRILQILGYPHTAVSTGAQALAMLDREHYDVVLLDIQMPDLDGLAAARLIRRNYLAERQPYLIAISASTSPGVREKCLDAGMNDCLIKPLRIPELQAALARYHASSATPAAPAAIMYERSVGIPTYASVPTPASPDPLDASTLDRVRALFGPQQDGRLRELIETYIHDSTALLATMYAANTAQNRSLLEPALHRLKSSSAIVAALPLANLCKQFEAALQTTEADDWQPWIERIEVEFTRARAALDQEL